MQARSANTSYRAQFGAMQGFSCREMKKGLHPFCVNSGNLRHGELCRGGQVTGSLRTEMLEPGQLG
jgi:hypothetical protein